MHYLCWALAGKSNALEKATQAWKSSAQMEKATWAGGPGEVARGARSRAERDDVHEMGGPPPILKWRPASI